jgi:DNA replication protein DnaC
MQSGVTLKEIESSINQLRNIHPSHVTTEKIKLLCAKQKEEQTPVLTYSSQKQLILNTIQKKHLQTYDQMFQTKNIHSLRRRSMIQSKQMWVEKIDTLSKELKLPKIRQDFEEIIKESIQIDASYEEFLAQLLQTELDARQESAKYNRIRRADFPYKKYLEDLSLMDLSQDAQKKLKLLKNLDFIKEGRNVILAGNAGTGKTHISIGLGIQACMEGYRVWFTTIPLLINQIKECRSQRTLRAFQNRFEKYDLVIADEMGYISFDKEGAELLFTHLSLRANQKATIITTNLSFERWGEIFQDPVMTAAMIDRLTHQAYIVNMIGDSYRMKETEKWLEAQQLTQ